MSKATFHMPPAQCAKERSYKMKHVDEEPM